MQIVCPTCRQSFYLPSAEEGKIIRCPKPFCRALIDTNDKSIIDVYAGKTVARQCRTCGHSMPPGMRFCENCGTAVKIPSSGWAIFRAFSSLFFFPPTGIVALYHACQIEPLSKSGDVEGAILAWKKFEIWILITFGCFVLSGIAIAHAKLEA